MFMKPKSFFPVAQRDGSICDNCWGKLDVKRTRYECLEVLYDAVRQVTKALRREVASRSGGVIPFQDIPSSCVPCQIIYVPYLSPYRDSEEVNITLGNVVEGIVPEAVVDCDFMDSVTVTVLVDCVVVHGVGEVNISGFLVTDSDTYDGFVYGRDGECFLDGSKIRVFFLEVDGLEQVL
ncbi:hypothetical protein NDU88_003579 [Pleurodeles waltl]|uniref:Uncharacterized protein n=1 Tax=Pleurodeles waltl TaxID=8319 RepID=A0AAV7NR90_PLEWA|nr:hypothetical protein NDU88_003579 [Pleurodeles waltl]